MAMGSSTVLAQSNVAPETANSPDREEHVKQGWHSEHLVVYQGFWHDDAIVPHINSVQKHFIAKPNQIFLASYPKSGTTWLKALIFAITNKTIYENVTSNNDSNAAAAASTTHPLLTKNPHEHVPTIEHCVAKNLDNLNSDDVPIWSTHFPYSSFSEQMLDSRCKIVYVARNPNDVFISLWHFAVNIRNQDLSPLTLEAAYEMFCEGASPCGPYWNHVLEFWNVSLKFPERVLFLNYDQMKENPFDHVKRLAEFLGHPFSPEQEEAGMVEKIISLCSFETLSNAEVNKNGAHDNGVYAVKNDSLFRKGKVGDWQNHLTKEKADKLNDIVAEKFKGSGLTL